MADIKKTGRESGHIERQTVLNLAMKWGIEQKRESDLAIVRLGGEVCREAFANMLEELATMFCSRHALFDLSETSFLKIEEGDIRYWLEKTWTYEKDCLAYRVQNGGRTAVFAPQDVNFGVARIWVALMECQRNPISFEAFRTEKEAMEWLLDGGEDVAEPHAYRPI